MDLTLYKLERAYPVRGFDSIEVRVILEYLKVTLLIDRRKIIVLFLIVGLGGKDLILGRKWLEDTNILVDYKN